MHSLCPMSNLCTAHIFLCTLYSPYNSVYTVQSMSNTIKNSFSSIHSLCLSVQCTMYSVQCTMYSVQCTMYSVQFMFRVHKVKSLSNLFLLLNVVWPTIRAVHYKFWNKVEINEKILKRSFESIKKYSITFKPEVKKYTKELVFATNSDFLIPIFVDKLWIIFD